MGISIIQGIRNRVLRDNMLGTSSRDNEVPSLALFYYGLYALKGFTTYGVLIVGGVFE